VSRAAGLAGPLLGLLLAAAPARAGEVLVRPAEGEERRGQLAGIDGKGLLLAAADGSTAKFELADLMAVEFPAAAAPEAAGCARLYTIAGDEIPAKVESDAEGRLRASGPWTGAFEVPMKSLSALLLPAGLKDERLRAELAARGRRRDRVFLPGGDYREGSLESLGAEGLKFKSVIGEETFKLADVCALAFTELKPWKPPAGSHCLAELAGGGHVSGAPVRLDGDFIEWRTLDGLGLRLAAGAIAAIRVRGARVTYLSDLAPAAVEERPFIAGLPFVWKWRADRDVLGGPLKLGGTAYGRGLGVAAYTKLVYKLDAGYRRFKAAAGVSDATAAGGHTLFRVLVDGKEVFATKPLVGRGDRPVSVDVSVEKARELALVIDFGDGSDLGDLGGWGDARLIR
jgi:hypothetical protein